MRTSATCLILALALHVAPLSARLDETALDREPAELTARESAISSDYARNRALFQTQRAELAKAPERLDEAIRNREAALRALREEKARLAERVAESSRDRLGGLRSLTRSVENATILLLQPFPVIGARLWNDSGDDATLSLETRSDSDDISLYLSILLPASLGLALVLASRVFPGFFNRHRRNLLFSVLLLMLILPLSSFAQERDPQSAKTSQEALPSTEPSIEEILRQADEVLGLSRIQRYIRLLTSPAAEGKRIRISGVDLSATPFTYFTSVVVGTGEYRATLAALHLAEGDRDAAVRELRALSYPDMRYATRDADANRYESLLRTAALFLLRNEAQALAVNVIHLHLPELSSSDSFRQLYPELLHHSLTVTAGRLAGQVIEKTGEPQRLIEYAETLYPSGMDTLARAALDKALRNANSPRTLEAIIEVGLAREDAAVVEAAAAAAPALIDDLAVLLRVSDTLRDAGRQALATRLLEDAITRTAASEFTSVQGRQVSSTEALTFLSSESFERRLLHVAEEAGIEAIKPLSRAERSDLVMTAPPVVIDPLRVPEPDSLVSPLYFGLLYEQQGRPDAAKQRFAAETRALAETLVASEGLYVPDMINHLSLLGSTLGSAEEAQTLAQLDRLLLRLEGRSLDDLRASQSEVMQRQQARIERADAQLLTLQKEIDALSAALEPRGTEILARAGSTLLLCLRTLALLALCCAVVIAVTTLARRDAQSRPTHRAYALWWKLVEGMGWVWVVSVFSAPLGLFAIVIAQFFLLPLGRKEQPSPAAEPQGRSEPSVAGPSAALPSEKQALEKSVLQMLRENRNVRAG